MEEHWTAQSGDTLLGMNRLVRDGKTVHKEFIWIETTEKGTSLSVRVFREPEETVVYALSEIGDRKAVFENVEHRRLFRMTYRLELEALVILLEGERANGSYREEISLHRL